MLLHKSSPAPACGLCCSCDRWVAGRRAAIPRPPAWDRSPEGWGHGCLRCQRAGQGSAGCCHQTSRQSECRALGLTLSPAAAPRIEAVLGRLRSLCTRPPWGCSSSRACMHTVSGQRGLTLPGPASCGRGEQSLREEGDESGPQAGREQHALPGNSHARAAGVLRCAATALVVCCRASIVAEGCAEIKRQVRSLSVLYARLCVPMPQCRHQILKPRGRCSEPRVPGASLPAAAAVINGSLPCAPAHRSRSQGRAPGGAVGSGPRRRARGGGGGRHPPAALGCAVQATRGRAGAGAPSPWGGDRLRAGRRPPPAHIAVGMPCQETGCKAADWSVQRLPEELQHAAWLAARPAAARSLACPPGATALVLGPPWSQPHQAVWRTHTMVQHSARPLSHACEPHCAWCRPRPRPPPPPSLLPRLPHPGAVANPTPGAPASHLRRPPPPAAAAAAHARTGHQLFCGTPSSQAARPLQPLVSRLVRSCAAMQHLQHWCMVGSDVSTGRKAPQGPVCHSRAGVSWTAALVRVQPAVHT